MKILISGATGMIGQHLVKELIKQDIGEIRILTRDASKAQEKFGGKVKSFVWDVQKRYVDPLALEDVDVIVHLAGENISSGRWTAKRKKEILESRTHSTATLLEGIAKQSNKPKKFISSSAVGIYGETHDQFADTNTTRGNDFLANVCKEWENTLLNSNVPNMEKICFRTGVVLSKNGGALAKMLPPFKMGAGGIIGTGKQYMSWIHIQDLVSQIVFLITKPTKHSIYNAVSPMSVTNHEFTKTLGKVIHRPTIIPIPAFGLKILFGEMSEILLSGQRVKPSEFLNEGFSFRYGNLEEALKNLLD